VTESGEGPLFMRVLTTSPDFGGGRAWNALAGPGGQIVITL
jgi:hypothetical protein